MIAWHGTVWEMFLLLVYVGFSLAWALGLRLWAFGFREMGDGGYHYVYEG